MKKFLFTCFLALPCLAGSPPFLSLVAQSPGADSLPTSIGPHRGGSSRSDAFSHGSPGLVKRGDEFSPSTGPPMEGSDQPVPQFSIELSGGEALVYQSGTSIPKKSKFDATVQPTPDYGRSKVSESSVSQQQSSFIGPKSTLEVNLSDEEFTRGQKEVSPAIWRENTQFVLIYGELINPDSLAPLRFTWKENLLPGDLALKDSSFNVQPKPGTFFDGVLDPRAQKFLVKIPVQSPLGRLSLELGNHSLIKEFLVFPGDSIKIGIDLQENTLVFGGPEKDWFEAQHAAFRARKATQFDSPRALLQLNREAFLDQEDYRTQLESQDMVFGARVGIYELGKDGLDREYNALFPKHPEGIPGLREALSYSDRLDPYRLDLLKSGIEAFYFRDHLSTLRKYNYSMILSLGDSVSAQRAMALFPEILELTGRKISELENKDGCTPCMDLALEWALINRILNGSSLEKGLAIVLRPELADQVLLSRGLRDLRSRGLNFEELAAIEKSLQGESTKQTWRTLTAAFNMGGKLPVTDFITLEGTRAQLSELIDRPTLLYFYFSTCTHSSNYFKNYLKPFFEKHHEPLGFQVVAISVDEDKALWRSQLSDYALPQWTNLNLEPSEWEKWTSTYQIQSFPRTLLIDSSGGIRAFTIGGQDFEEYSERLIFLLRAAQEPISHHQFKPY